MQASERRRFSASDARDGRISVAAPVVPSGGKARCCRRKSPARRPAILRRRRAGRVDDVVVPIHRRSAMRVRDGRVLKKNNWRLDTGGYRALPQAEIRLDRRRPADGYRHLTTIAELRSFVALLPDWEEVAIGLDAIVLDSATDCAGWCGPGVVAICAWPHDLWDCWSPQMVHEHRDMLDLLAVERVPVEERTNTANCSTSSRRSAYAQRPCPVSSSCAGPSHRRAPISCCTSCRTGSGITTIASRAEHGEQRGAVSPTPRPTPTACLSGSGPSTPAPSTSRSQRRNGRRVPARSPDRRAVPRSRRRLARCATARPSITEPHRCRRRSRALRSNGTSEFGRTQAALRK